MSRQTYTGNCGLEEGERGLKCLNFEVTLPPAAACQKIYELPVPLRLFLQDKPSKRISLALDTRKQGEDQLHLSRTCMIHSL